jgi:putative YhbY family RNA-binding protein
MPAKKSPAKNVAARKVPTSRSAAPRTAVPRTAPRGAAGRSAPKQITPSKRLPVGRRKLDAIAPVAPKPRVIRPQAALTGAMRTMLRGRAHDLDPVVMIGADGLTPAVVAEAEAALAAHELIKVRVFGDDREERIRIFERLCAGTGAEPVQHIGKLLVLYRQKAAAIEREHSANFAEPREVTVKKPSRTGNRAAKRSRVTVLANQRVTAGGLVKRQKPRQKSTKKQGQ